MITYETEQDYLNDFDNHALSPREEFYVEETRQRGFAHSASEAILYASFDATAQFGQVNCSKLVCTGDVELSGVLKIDNEQVLP